MLFAQALIATFCSSRKRFATFCSSRKRSSRLTQDVPNTAQRVQQPLLAGVNLPPQIGNVGLHDVDVSTEVVAPHVVEDLGLGQHRARVDDEVPQQRELGG